MPRAAPAMAVSVTVWAMWTVWGLPAVAGATADVGSIQAEQQQVVRNDHAQAIQAAQAAVGYLQGSVDRDQQNLAEARQEAIQAQAAAAAAQQRLGGDESQLRLATEAVTSERSRLAADRNRLGGIAIGMYTGQLTNPQPSGIDALEAAQEAVIDAAEVEVVARNVGEDLRATTAALRGDLGREERFAAAVQSDTRLVTSAGLVQSSASARMTAAEAALGADTANLSAADGQLSAAQDALASALAAVAGPGQVSTASTGGSVSILGGSALDAAQLVGWYESMGYVDLTGASIDQLASWYIQIGAEEGVRGDVAFAQAVLETAGFSSPDSARYSNFAGIGHCDTCSSGWAFPSPEAGVAGQLQLLRIFAGGGDAPTPPAPPPVLPQLTPSNQHEAGCCGSVESLTGVWATDPLYGASILALYQGMLSFALSRPAG